MRHTKIGAVCAFIDENPPHSEYNIKTICNAIECLPDFQMTVIANGVINISDNLRSDLNKNHNVFFLELSKNIGLPVAWNLGIDLLNCDYIFFFNDDIWLDKYCIDSIINVFKQKHDSAVVGVEGVICSELGENGFPTTKTRYKKKKRKWFSIQKIIDVTNVSGFLFAVNMNFIRKTNFRYDSLFSPAFCEEFDLAFFARKHGYKCRILTGLDKHYDHIHGISANRRTISYIGGTIDSDELTERNVKLFCNKWKDETRKLLIP